MRVSASIVIYNEKEETLQRVIESFLGIKYELELVIVDNSTKDKLRDLCNKYDFITYIFSGKNIGFGAGHNNAFSNLLLLSDVHIIVNPDVYFDGNNLQNFLYEFIKNKTISLATLKVLNIDGSEQNVVRNIPTPISLIKRNLHINNDELDYREDAIYDIPFAHGCFMVFKSEVFKNIKGFDERFFLYMEDVDIFIKAKQYGRTVMNTNYTIHHEYRKGSSKSLKLLLWHIVSATKFFWKYR